jgi:hypothetical protein
VLLVRKNGLGRKTWADDDRYFLTVGGTEQWGRPTRPRMTWGAWRDARAALSAGSGLTPVGAGGRHMRARSAPNSGGPSR